MSGFNLSDWALQQPLVRRLLHDRGAGRRRRLLLQPRPRRGSAVHLPDHGRPGRLARRDAGRHAAAGHRAARAQAAGDAEARLPAQLHQRRPHHDLRQPEGRDAGPRGAGHLVPGAQEGRRHPPHPAGGRASARASTTTSATPSASSTASPRTASPSANCATTVEDVRSSCCTVPDVSKIEIIGAQDERIYHRVLDRAARRPRHRPRAPCSPRCRRRTSVSPAGAFETGDETDRAAGLGRLRHRAGHRSTSTSPSATGCCGWATSPRSGAAYADPPQPHVPRQRQAGHRPRHRHARRRRHPGARAQHQEGDRRRSPPTCRSASSRVLVADQPVDGRRRPSASSSTSLWQAIAIILVGELHQPRRARRRGRGARRSRSRSPSSFAMMDMRRHRSAAHLARRADHRAGAAGRRRHDDDRRHDAAPGAGRRRRRRRRPIAYKHLAVADAGRHAGHHRRLRADRLRRGAPPANTPSRSSPWSASR